MMIIFLTAVLMLALNTETELGLLEDPRERGPPSARNPLLMGEIPEEEFLIAYY